LNDCFAKKQGTVSDNIIKLVKEHPTVTNDYRKLQWYYWFFIDGLVDYLPMERMMNLTQPESIGRAFRKLVEQGYIIVDEKTKKARLKEEENYRRYYGGKNW